MRITIEVSAENYRLLQAEAEYRTIRNAHGGLPAWTAEEIVSIYGIMAVEAEVKKREVKRKEAEEAAKCE